MQGLAILVGQHPPWSWTQFQFTDNGRLCAGGQKAMASGWRRRMAAPLARGGPQELQRRRLSPHLTANYDSVTEDGLKLLGKNGQCWLKAIIRWSGGQQLLKKSKGLSRRSHITSHIWLSSEWQASVRLEECSKKTIRNKGSECEKNKKKKPIGIISS